MTDNDSENIDAVPQSMKKIMLSIVGGLALITLVLQNGSSLVEAAREFYQQVTGFHTEVVSTDIPSDCWQVDVQMPPEVPYTIRDSLYRNKHAFGKRDTLDHQFAIIDAEIVNDCDYRLQLTLEASLELLPSGAPPLALESPLKPQRVTINKGKRKPIHWNPDITIAGNFSSDLQLVVSWSLHKDKGQAVKGERIDGGQRSTKILNADAFVWNLLNARREPANREFLVASLANWTAETSSVKEVRSAVKNTLIEQATPDEQYPVKSIEESIAYLQHVHNMQFVSRPIAFNPGDSTVRRIDRPSQLLEGNASASDVELALLVLAVVKDQFNDRGLEPAFLFTNNTVFLSWVDSNSNWGGVNLTKIVKQINTPGGTASVVPVNDLMAVLNGAVPGLFAKLDESFKAGGDGVYVDNQTASYAFGVYRAVNSFDIAINNYQ